MAGFTERLAYFITANGKEAIRAFKDVKASAKEDLGEAETRVGKFGKGAKGFGAGIGAAAKGFGAAAAAGAFLAFGNAADQAYQRVRVWRVKVATVFEDSAEDVRKWADANNEALGLTDDELAGAAASFGDLLKPMGFTASAAAEMSKSVVGLSGALAAWSGGQRTATEVAQILAKAMLGERESLKELGISILESEVQARVAEKGQSHLTGALLQQAKAVASQELIFEKSTDAQRAWADGSMDAVKAQNKLQAEIKETSEEFGETLAEPKAGIQKTLSTIIGFFNDLNKVGKKEDKSGWLDKGLWGVIRDWGKESEKAAPKVEKLGDKIDETTTAIDEQAEAADEAASALAAYTDIWDEVVDATLGIPNALDDVDAAFQSLSDNAEDSSKAAADAQDRLADSIEDSNRRIRDAEQDVADAREDLGKISSGDRTAARRSLRDAEERLADTRKDSAEAIAEAKEDAAELVPSLGEAAEASRKTREDMEKIVTAVETAVTEMIKQKKPASEILAYIESQKTKLGEIGTEIGVNTTDLGIYVGVLEAAYQTTKELVELSKEMRPSWLAAPPSWGWGGPKKGEPNAGFGAEERTGWGGVTIVQQFYGPSDPTEEQRQAARAFNGTLRRRG